MPTSLEDEVRGIDPGEAPGDILDVLRATSASDLAILEAFELAMAEIETSGFDRYTKIRFEPAPGANDTVIATFDRGLFWQDLTAAAHKRLVG